MMKIIAWFTKNRIHFLSWILFFIYENGVEQLLVSKHGSFLRYTTHYTIIISFFYFHCNTLLPWIFRNKKAVIIWKFPLSVIVELATLVSLYYLDDVWLTSINVHLMDGKPSFTLYYWLIHSYRAVYYLGISTGYYFVRNYVRETKKTEALEREKLNEIIKRQKIEQELTRAQNAFLKAQINPHFLFNTLDFVYHNVSELSPKAADAIITLSEMMRYAIDADKMGEFIYIGDEIEQVQNLQYLNRLRKNEDMLLQLIYPDEVRSISFIPLVLLTLAENIFKHGNLHKGQEAVMEIYIENGLLVIKTDNASSRQKANKSNRTGLANIEQRLKHAYGDSVYFNYHLDDDWHFRLIIKVPVQQLKNIATPSPASAGVGAV